MKIVNFTSGLGNQIFEYLFVEYLKSNYPNQSIYGYYSAKKLQKHNGLEIHNVFDVQLPSHSLWSDSVAWMCRKLNGIGIKGLKATDSTYSDKAIYYDGWWQDKKFFLDNLDIVKFLHFELDTINVALLEKIKNCNSVSIHIRRGDYLEPKYAKAYGGICTMQYYEKAIELILERIPDAEFFVFSNDIGWVKENMQIPHPVYISNNIGKNSFLDMYLMAHCKGAIIANSSFSYWGAMLNHNKPIVVYPKKWFNTHTPNIFKEDWIALNEK